MSLFAGMIPYNYICGRNINSHIINHHPSLLELEVLAKPQETNRVLPLMSRSETKFLAMMISTYSEDYEVSRSCDRSCDVVMCHCSFLKNSPAVENEPRQAEPLPADLWTAEKKVSAVLKIKRTQHLNTSSL